MIWPFKDAEQRRQKIAKLSEDAGENRSRMYSKLFELDVIDRSLEEMVKRSLELMTPGHKNEPPHT